MATQRRITLDDVLKSEIAICPECGVLFVKTVRGETWGFWDGSGIYCPVCEGLVTPGKEAEDE